MSLVALHISFGLQILAIIVIHPRSCIEYEGSGPGVRIHLLATPILIGLAFEALATAIPSIIFDPVVFLGLSIQSSMSRTILPILHRIEKIRRGGEYPHTLNSPPCLANGLGGSVNVYVGRPSMVL